MSSSCPNCLTALNGKYCSQCGQRADAEKITLHYIWHDIQHSLHVDKGLLFTSKELFSRPGHTIREFLEGKRVKHFKPVSLILLLAGLYGFLCHYFDINVLSNNIQVSGTGDKASQLQVEMSKMSAWVSQHYSILSILQIPIFSIGTYLAFKKSGYNFVEHLVLNTYLTGQRLLFHLFTFPLYYLYNDTTTLRPVARTVDIIVYVLMFWSLMQFFNTLSWFQKLIRVVLSFIISFSIIFIVLTLTVKYIITSFH